VTLLIDFIQRKENKIVKMCLEQEFYKEEDVPLLYWLLEKENHRDFAKYLKEKHGIKEKVDRKWMQQCLKVALLSG